MTASIHEIAPDIFRIAHHPANARITFVQFLIKDEKPLLFHTGSKALFPDTLEAVQRILDPAGLRYISWSHLESDECGALSDFLAVAPDAEPVHSALGARYGADFFPKAVTPLEDDCVLDLGEKKIRFLVTPHVPHSWDAILAFEETTGTLLLSDLFTSYGEQPAVTESDIVEPSVAALKQSPTTLPIGPHTFSVFDRLEALQPQMLAGHHSSAYTGDALQALRDLRSELSKMAV
jgi:flavorubredoxin